MELLVRRLWFNPECTVGELSIGGIFECYTMEPRADQSQGKPYCIPEGTYEIVLQPSLHFHRVTPHLLGVPGFEAIEIHPGNFPKDTEGCTLVGKSFVDSNPNFIGQSQAAFDDVMAKLVTLAPITYRNEPVQTSVKG